MCENSKTHAIIQHCVRGRLKWQETPPALFVEILNKGEFKLIIEQKSLNFTPCWC